MFLPRSNINTFNPFCVSSLAAHPPLIPDPTTIAAVVLALPDTDALAEEEPDVLGVVLPDADGEGVAEADCEGELVLDEEELGEAMAERLNEVDTDAVELTDAETVSEPLKVEEPECDGEGVLVPEPLDDGEGLGVLDAEIDREAVLETLGLAVEETVLLSEAEPELDAALDGLEKGERDSDGEGELVIEAV